MSHYTTDMRHMKITVLKQAVPFIWRMFPLTPTSKGIKQPVQLTFRNSSLPCQQKHRAFRSGRQAPAGLRIVHILQFREICVRMTTKNDVHTTRSRNKHAVTLVSGITPTEMRQTHNNIT